jgi:hypothetical protein
VTTVHWLRFPDSKSSENNGVSEGAAPDFGAAEETTAADGETATIVANVAAAITVRITRNRIPQI